jgi:sialidase-1
MSEIEVLDHYVVYENPTPQAGRREGYFPHVVRLPDGELLAMYVLGSEFEAADHTPCVSRSSDSGRTWTYQGPIYDRAKHHSSVMMTLKPTVLRDGSLVAVGYGFDRPGDTPMSNPKTGGLPPAKNYVTFSHDGGRTWTPPQAFTLKRPEVLEVSGPCFELSNGELLAVGPTFPLWDASHPSGHVGVVLRSRDGGKTWDDSDLFHNPGERKLNAYETRGCEMQPGRVVLVTWFFDEQAGKSLTNHIYVSHDFGRTWSPPIDTHVPGQSSWVSSLGGDRLVSIHCQREGPADRTGLYVRVVDFAGDKWNVLAEKCIWTASQAVKIGSLSDMGALKFGQASLLSLGRGEWLAAHWAILGERGKILAHRIRLPDR